MLAFLIASVILTQGSVDTYGKTEAQILEMEPKHWYDYYTSKAGESTYAMSRAYGIYADVAEKRNEQIIKKLPADKARRIHSLGKLIVSFGGAMVELGSDLSGGGTMWGPIGNSSYADAQDVIYTLLTRPKPHLPKVTAKDVEKLVSAAPRLLKANSDLLNPDQKKQSVIDYRDAVKMLHSLKEAIATLSPDAQIQIFTYCRDQAKLLDVAAP